MKVSQFRTLFNHSAQLSHSHQSLVPCSQSRPHLCISQPISLLRILRPVGTLRLFLWLRRGVRQTGDAIAAESLNTGADEPIGRDVVATDAILRANILHGAVPGRCRRCG